MVERTGNNAIDRILQRTISAEETEEARLQKYHEGIAEYHKRISKGRYDNDGAEKQREYSQKLRERHTLD